VNSPRAVLELVALVRGLPIAFRTALWEELESRAPAESASGSVNGD
jgi:hypothetical protein